MTLEHVGYIVDGNRRWAKARGLPSIQGHKKGFEVLKEIVEVTFERGVKFVTAFIFSTENWNRSKEEVDYLMHLFESYFDREVKKLHKKDIRVVFLGSRTKNVSKKLVGLMEKGEELTKNNRSGTLGLCFNYGGQLEIAEACQKIVDSGVKKVTTKLIDKYIYHAEIPPMDMLVRTSGEQRISNFMLWRISYAEMMWVEKFWPDMAVGDVDAILNEYASRQRRHGR
ncbi:MAG: di-trans,poly-cis-decaprenylcistransferase [Candidatus Nomurabacteria bacterium]|jgi:undecaprenyl diphosphate synthase|nr:di-trans,poly-cis-decaprenylcistransferase [Candidatus Nomurabacteria bacterium]